MFNISLKKQLIVISGIPFLFYSVLSLFNARQSFALYQKTKEAQSDLVLLTVLSQVVHETQIERGRSAVFLNGGIELSEVMNQQKKTDEKITALTNVTAISGLAQNLVKDFKEIPSKYGSLRERISSKSITPAEVIKGYNELIASFLKSELLFAEASDIIQLKSALYSIAILEEAKESAGKLRATMSSILTRNVPISSEHFSLLVDLKGKIDANIYSPAVVASDETKRLISGLFRSSEWQDMNRVYKIILTKGEVGTYGEDPKVFFKTISAVIDSINNITVTQIGDASEKMRSIQESSFNTLLVIVSILLITLIALVMISSTIIKKIYTVIHQISRELQESAKRMSTASHDIAASSVELSESSIEQASALQETVSSIDEINAMVAKNADSARNGHHLSKNSKSATVSGKDRIDELSRAITKINSSSIQVMNEFKNNNLKIAEITKVISDIGEKTKIINDIVFQTKILSFNASVESARAGEHGKGFSVVAQEIGSLAQMSGTAAQEIADLMSGKTEWVDNIIKETSQKMEMLLQQSGDEVKSGALTAKMCSDALDEIMENADLVNKIVEEIATASDEQAKGVHEITKAMQQLDQVTQKNTQVATQSSASSYQLSDQGVKLQRVVDKLVYLIEGAP